MVEGNSYIHTDPDSGFADFSVGSRFVFYLQPKVELQSGKIIGAEALARCKRNDGSVILPESFIPKLEKSGEVVMLDFLIIESVCRHIRQRLDDGLPVVRISVNLSGKHLYRPDTAERISDIVTGYKVPSSLVGFELAESLLVDDYQRADKMIGRLREKGFCVSIDDFGSGYSGINLWRELNFDGIKLGKCFLCNDYYRADSVSLLPDIIQTANRMKNAVICEGVETEENCKTLMRLGCTYAQGYYFSKPVEPEQFWSTYDRIGGYYPTPYIEQSQGSEFPCPEEKKKRPKKSVFPIYVSFLVIVLVLLAVIPVVYLLQKHRVIEVYKDTIADSVEGDLDANVRASELRVGGIVNSMTSFASLIRNQNFANLQYCLDTLKECNRDAEFWYSELDDISAMADYGVIGESGLRSITAGKYAVSGILRKGEHISDSKSAGNDCYLVLVPVTDERDKLKGCITASVGAGMLTDIGGSFGTYCDSISAVLIDLDGRLMFDPSGKRGDGTEFDATVIDGSFSDDVADRVREAIIQKKSICVRESSGVCNFFAASYSGFSACFVAVYIDCGRAVSLIDNQLGRLFYIVVSILAVLAAYCSVMLYVISRKDKQLQSVALRWTLLEQFSDTALFTYNVSDDCLTLTPNASQLFRMRQPTVPGFISGDGTPSVYPYDFDKIKNAVTPKSGQIYSELKVRLLSPYENKYNWCMVQIRYIYENGSPVSIVGKILDIDRLQRDEASLVKMAKTDGLTGLLNRVEFERLVREQLLKNTKGMFVVLDLDIFKTVNDRLGHSIGDEVLKIAANKINSVFPVGITGRIGGDEFAVFVPDYCDRTSVKMKIDFLSERIKASTGKKYGMEVGISGGIAVLPDDGFTYEALFSISDSAMYMMKKHR